MSRTVVVTPNRWLPRGDAVVEVPGRKALVVWGGIPGEPGVVRLQSQGAHQVRGDWVKSDEPDSHRVAPPCDRYASCGGCGLMHLDAAGQAGARRWLVAESLQGAGLDVPVLPLVPCPDGASGYRHVVKVGFGVSDAGRVRVGAWGRGSREIVPIPGCLAAAPVLRRAMVSLAHHTIGLGIEPYDPGRNRGVLRAAVLRASRSSGEVLVTLVAARKDRQLEELAEELARGVPEIVGIWLHLNDGVGNAIFAHHDQGVVGVLPLVGRESIEERLGGVAYRLGPGDFFQTNPSVAEKLYDGVLDALELQAGDTLVDLYCGVGGISLAAAKRLEGQPGFVLGVEEVDGAVKRAKEAARGNRLNAEFVAGKVSEILPEIGVRLDGVGPKIVVNPARRGLEPDVLEPLLALNPSRIVYVSCNPKALARDLSDLVAKGWSVGPVTPYDMFPNTPHVECLVALTPPEGSAAAVRRAPRRQLVRP